MISEEDELFWFIEISKAHSLTFRAKVKVIAKIIANAPRTKKHASQKNLSRGSLSNWCDAVKQYDDPTLWGVDIIIIIIIEHI